MNRVFLLVLLCLLSFLVSAQQRLPAKTDSSNTALQLNPVEFSSFQAKRNGNIVEVSWNTNFEVNSDYFIVQRSKDTETFFDVIQALAAGNSESEEMYNSDDYDPYEGNSYYRITMVDNDGRSFFSERAEVIVPQDHQIAVYPNPATGPINVYLKVEAGDEVVLIVRDVFGKEFYSSVVVSDSDSEIFVIDPTNKIPPGIFVVVATSNDYVYEKKIVVQ